MATDKVENDTILHLEHVSKSFYGRNQVFEAINDITLDVKENEFLVLLGPGRCGKTILLNIIAKLEKPTIGEISFNNGSENIGFVFQKTAVFPWKTVMENIEFPMEIVGVPKKERQERAQYLIDLVGLHGFEKSLPKQLSGGMRQRVGIARAYSSNPTILLMDEPFGALDAQTRYQMEEEVLRIWQKEKRTVVFVTNNIEEAIYLGDRIVLLSECPAHIKEIYKINLSRPRDYVDNDFLHLRETIEANTDLAL